MGHHVYIEPEVVGEPGVVRDCRRRRIGAVVSRINISIVIESHQGPKPGECVLSIV